MFLLNKVSPRRHQRDRPISRQSTATPASYCSSYNDSTPSLAASLQPYASSASKTVVSATAAGAAPRKRRMSIFGGRSRSQTTSSGANSFTSASSSLTSADIAALRMPQEQLSSPDRSSRFFFRRDRKSRRDSMDPAEFSGISESDLGKLQKGLEGASRFVREQRSSSARPPRKRRNISAPYDFQHLSHTGSNEARYLHPRSLSYLADKVPAARSSASLERPLVSKDLHFRNFSTEAIVRSASEDNLSGRDSPMTSGTQSPRRDMRRMTPSPAGSYRGLKHSRSIDSLRVCPPKPATFTGKLFPTSPPPRTSSRGAVTVSMGPGSPRKRSPSIPDLSTPGNAFSEPVTVYPPVVQEVQEDVEMQEPHAVTTVEDFAWPLIPTTFGSIGTELDDVPEEEESCFGKRSSSAGPRGSTSNATLRASARPPSSSANKLGLTINSDTTVRPSSSNSDTLGGPFCLLPLKEFEDIPRSPEIKAADLTVVDGCWEDDIDYSYEHAAESSCEYDWDRKSAHGYEDEHRFTFGGQPIITNPPPSPSSPTRKEMPAPTKIPLPLPCTNAFAANQSLYANAPQVVRKAVSRPSLIVPPYEEVPALEPTSALSSFGDTEAHTPPQPALSEPFQVGHSLFRDSEEFHLSPSLLAMPDFDDNLMLDSIYTEHYEHAKSVKDYYQSSLYSGAYSTSSRSYQTSNASHSRINSEDSFTFSNMGSPIIPQSPVHRLSRSNSTSQKRASVIPDKPLPSLPTYATAKGIATLEYSYDHGTRSRTNSASTVPQKQKKLQQPVFHARTSSLPQNNKYSYKIPEQQSQSQYQHSNSLTSQTDYPTKLSAPPRHAPRPSVSSSRLSRRLSNASVSEQPLSPNTHRDALDMAVAALDDDIARLHATTASGASTPRRASTWTSRVDAEDILSPKLATHSASSSISISAQSVESVTTAEKAYTAPSRSSSLRRANSAAAMNARERAFSDVAAITSTRIKAAAAAAAAAANAADASASAAASAVADIVDETSSSASSTIVDKEVQVNTVKPVFGVGSVAEAVRRLEQSKSMGVLRVPLGTPQF